MGFRDYDSKWLEQQLQKMSVKKDGGVNTVGGIFSNIAEFQGSYSTLAEACAAYGVGYPGIAGQQYYCDGVGLSSVGVNVSSQNTASQNTSIIQSALDAGGEVELTGNGTILINNTLTIKSNTKLTIAPGLTIKLDSFSDCQILKNVNSGFTTSATVSGSNYISRTSNIVTVSERNHKRVIGDKVLIEGLLTDTSFNGLFTITAITQHSWSYASLGANGAPTGFARINPANYQIDAANFSSSSNVVTVTETGHTRQFGDSVYIGNLATNTSFNGAYQITNVSGNTWQYIKTGTDTAPTGAAVVLGDNNIELNILGALDVNQVNQGFSTQYTGSTASFGIILGNCSKIKISGGKYFNARKYAHWLYNVTDVVCENIYYNTNSDGLHFEAPADRVVIKNIYGKTLDDFVAFTNVNSSVVGASYGAVASPSGLGDFGSVLVDGILPANSSCPAGLKYAGYTGYTFKSLTVKNVSGTLSSTGNAGLSLVDDTSCLTGGRIEKFVLDGFYVTGGGASSNAFSINLSGGAGTVSINNVRIDDNVNATVNFYLNTSMDSIKFNNIDVGYSSAGTGKQVISFYSGTYGQAAFDNCSFKSNGSAIGIILQSTATIGTCYLSNCYSKLMDSLFKQNSGTSVISEIFATGIKLLQTANGISTMTNSTVYCDNLVWSGGSNHAFQIAGGTVRVVGKNMNIPAGNVLLLNYSGSVISYSCPDAQAGLDMGAGPTTPTGMTPIAGDVIYNTNAGNKGLFGYTAAGAWAKIF